MKIYQRGDDGQWHAVQTTILRIVRQWIFWPVGWETRNEGIKPEGAPWPVSIWGGAVQLTDEVFGVRVGGQGMLVGTWKEKGRPQKGLKELFLTSCGKPCCATAWLVGAPPKIVTACEQRAQA